MNGAIDPHPSIFVVQKPMCKVTTKGPVYTVGQSTFWVDHTSSDTRSRCPLLWVRARHLFSATPTCSALARDPLEAAEARATLVPPPWLTLSELGEIQGLFSGSMDVLRRSQETKAADDDDENEVADSKTMVIGMVEPHFS